MIEVLVFLLCETLCHGANFSLSTNMTKDLTQTKLAISTSTTPANSSLTIDPMVSRQQATQEITASTITPTNSSLTKGLTRTKLAISTSTKTPTNSSLTINPMVSRQTTREINATTTTAANTSPTIDPMVNRQTTQENTASTITPNNTSPTIDPIVSRHVTQEISTSTMTANNTLLTNNPMVSHQTTQEITASTIAPTNNSLTIDPMVSLQKTQELTSSTITWTNTSATIDLIQTMGENSTAYYITHNSTSVTIDPTRTISENITASTTPSPPPPSRNNSYGPKLVVFSPLFPNPYPKNIYCDRTLHASNDSKQPVLRIPWLEIDESPDCNKDRLEIRNGSSQASPEIPSSPFCGKAYPKNTPMKYSVWVRFVSDDSTESNDSRGFILEFFTGNFRDPREVHIKISQAPTGW